MIINAMAKRDKFKADEFHTYLSSMASYDVQLQQCLPHVFLEEDRETFTLHHITTSLAFYRQVPKRGNTSWLDHGT